MEGPNGSIIEDEKQIADSFTNASGNSISSNGVNSYNFVILPEGNCKLLALPSKKRYLILLKSLTLGKPWTRWF